MNVPKPNRPSRHVRYLLVPLVLLLLPATALATTNVRAAPEAAAQAPTSRQVEAPAGELAGIRAALERIVVLLEQQTADRRAGLALQRLDVENGRLARLEGRLAAVRDTRASVQDQRLQLEESYRQFVRQAERSEEGLSDEERLAAREDLDGRVELLEARLADLDRQAMELENRLAERRQAVRDWESFVDRNLGE